MEPSTAVNTPSALRGPVLVATDLSTQADEALRQGARLTLGSTAASVIESAPCSVLVVRLVDR